VQVILRVKETMWGKIHRKAIGAYAGATALCLLILLWVMRLWRADLSIPFAYFGGDEFYYGMLIKGLLDNGWYLHNRFLGMPSGLDLHDFPEWANFHLLLMKFISFWTSDYAVVFNLYFLLTFPLTVLTSLFVFRRFNVSYPPAIVGSLLFAFLPYHFQRGQWHFFLASYYLIPLMIMVILWVCLGEPLFRYEKGNRKPLWGWATPKAIGSLAICVVVASGGVYYAFFAGFFLLVAGVFAFFRQRSFRPLLASGILLAVLFLAFVVNVSPSIMYAYQHGKNKSVARRGPEEVETYGMKIAQLLMPVSGHRVPSLAKLKEKYNRRAPLVNENQNASLGTIGAFGFLVLIGWLIYGKLDVHNAELFNSLSVLNISAVLLATIGGFGSLFAFLISPMIRAYNRISVYIAFFSLFAVVLLLEDLEQRWGRSKTVRCLFGGLLGVILLLGILDQTIPGFIPPYDQFRAEYTSDADFVRRIEASVPGNAMIFQLPYMPFPETPWVHRMWPYDHFRGYLHSKTLRWSYGAMKGREGDAWQRQIEAKPLNELVETLAFVGFSGIYLDRYGYADQGSELEAKLSKLLDTKPIVSANQRLVFFNLAKFNRELREKYTAEEWQRKRDAALHLSFLRDDFEHLLAKQFKAVGDSPHLSIATDRPRYRRGDVLNVTVDLVNSESSHTVDAYLALAWPDGRLFFWDGNGFSLYTSGRWVPLARGIGLAKGVRVTNHPLLSLKGIDMPRGSYTWYLILTEPNTFNVIAKAQATFTLEP